MPARVFKCGASDATVPERISKWDAVGTYLGQTGFPQNNRNDSFVIDRDGFLYIIVKVGSGSSTDLFLTQRHTGFTSGLEVCRRRRSAASVSVQGC